MYLDDKFLNDLFSYPHREIFARITALNFQEKGMEFIEGKVTGGSINIDGNSIVRRTCSLTLVAQNVNINQFYWGLYNKFNLEIGLRNYINKNYPEIIWFKQGIYIITNFNTTYNVNNYNISISGKDKMCLLNGDIAGALPHTTDFGIEEYDDGNTRIFTNIKIRTILTEMLQNFGNELIQNIIINDLEDVGMDLLEYRGDVPLYLLKNENTDLITNMTMNQLTPCFIADTNERTTIGDSDKIIYNTLSDLSDLRNNGTKVYFENNSQELFTIVELTYGALAGYRLTELIYAGDLIANAGESVTSILDKIVNMLGNFEYFYDVNGKFIFQRKRNYIDTQWNSLVKAEEGTYVDYTKISSYTYNLLDNLLITSFQNTPNLLELKNDYTVWGKKLSASGIELDIHMRYAIDKKPTIYTTIPWVDENNNIKKESKTYTSKEYDWRELIYQMALDYRQNYHKDNFLSNIAKYNPDYIYGKTGYEQYYIDLEGFWRLLYDPESESDEYYPSSHKNKYWNKSIIENPENLIFWFDFLDAESSNISNYSVPLIGSRTKVVNDNDVKTIYYRNIPQIIFLSSNDGFSTQTGYTSVQLQPTMENLFTISSKAKSCKEAIDQLLYKHSYCSETVNITSLPIYHLEPNYRILVKDDNSKINGEYIINKITIPLTYNGTMTIAASKAVDSLN